MSLREPIPSDEEGGGKDKSKKEESGSFNLSNSSDVQFRGHAGNNTDNMNTPLQEALRVMYSGI